MNRVECPGCGQRLKFAGEHAGKRAKCNKCGYSFTLPQVTPRPMALPVAIPVAGPAAQASTTGPSSTGNSEREVDGSPASYYLQSGRQVGPVSSRELKVLVAAGKLLPTDLIWKEDMAEWRPAAELKGLFPAKPAGTPRKRPVAPAPTAAPVAEPAAPAALPVSQVAAEPQASTALPKPPELSPLDRFLDRAESVFSILIFVYFLASALFANAAARETIRGENLGDAVARDTGATLSSFYQVAFEPANLPARLILPKGGRYQMFSDEKRTYYLDVAPIVSGILAAVVLLSGLHFTRKLLRIPPHPYDEEGKE